VGAVDDAMLQDIVTERDRSALEELSRCDAGTAPFAAGGETLRATPPDALSPSRPARSPRRGDWEMPRTFGAGDPTLAELLLGGSDIRPGEFSDVTVYDPSGAPPGVATRSPARPTRPADPRNAAPHVAPSAPPPLRRGAVGAPQGHRLPQERILPRGAGERDARGGGVEVRPGRAPAGPRRLAPRCGEAPPPHPTPPPRPPPPPCARGSGARPGGGPGGGGGGARGSAR